METEKENKKETNSSDKKKVTLFPADASAKNIKESKSALRRSSKPFLIVKPAWYFGINAEQSS